MTATAKSNSVPNSPHSVFLGEEQPRRPLSAYNYFFRSERARLLGLGPVDFDNDVREKRRHRKTHGKIGFREMANQVGTKWKSLTEEEKAPYTRLFQRDRARYKAEMKAWNDRMKKRQQQRIQMTHEIQEQTKKSNKDPVNHQDCLSATVNSASRAVASPPEVVSSSIWASSNVSEATLALSDEAINASLFYDSQKKQVSSSLSKSQLYDISAEFDKEKCGKGSKINGAIDAALNILNDDDFELFDSVEANELDSNKNRRKRPHADFIGNETLDLELREFIHKEVIEVDEEKPPATELDFDRYLKGFDFGSEDEREIKVENNDDDLMAHSGKILNSVPQGQDQKSWSRRTKQFPPYFDQQQLDFSVELEQSKLMMIRLKDHHKAMEAAMKSMKGVMNFDQRWNYKRNRSNNDFSRSFLNTDGHIQEQMSRHMSTRMTQNGMKNTCGSWSVTSRPNLLSYDLPIKAASSNDVFSLQHQANMMAGINHEDLSHEESGPTLDFLQQSLATLECELDDLVTQRPSQFGGPQSTDFSNKELDRRHDSTQVSLEDSIMWNDCGRQMDYSHVYS